MFRRRLLKAFMNSVCSASRSNWSTLVMVDGHHISITVKLAQQSIKPIFYSTEKNPSKTQLTFIILDIINMWQIFHNSNDGKRLAESNFNRYIHWLHEHRQQWQLWQQSKIHLTCSSHDKNNCSSELHMGHLVKMVNSWVYCSLILGN